jgi:hypothetical protein
MAFILSQTSAEPLAVIRQNTTWPLVLMISSGCLPLIPMMQSADFGDLDHHSQSGGCLALGSGESLDTNVFFKFGLLAMDKVTP